MFQCDARFLRVIFWPTCACSEKAEVNKKAPLRVPSCPSTCRPIRKSLISKLTSAPSGSASLPQPQQMIENDCPDGCCSDAIKGEAADFEFEVSGAQHESDADGDQVARI